MGSVGEGMIVNGTGVQTTTNSRWGDYTSMNVDPVDDCTFWYVNEYYTAAGQASSRQADEDRLLQAARLQLTEQRRTPGAARDSRAARGRYAAGIDCVCAA